MSIFRSDHELIHLVHHSKTFGRSNVGIVARDIVLRNSNWQRLSGDTWRNPDGVIYVEKRLANIREIAT